MNEPIIGFIIFVVAAVGLLTCAFVVIVRHYGIVKQNQELREYVAFSETRRQRAMQYLLDTVCRHDQEYIDYAVAKKLGLLAPPPEKAEKPPLRIHNFTAPSATPHHREPRRQPEPPQRVVVVTQPPPQRSTSTRRLPFFGQRDDDDVIDVTPNPPSPHRAMPQVPLLIGPRNKGGRPRKYGSNAARQQAYNQRKKQS